MSVEGSGFRGFGFWFQGFALVGKRDKYHVGIMLPCSLLGTSKLTLKPFVLNTELHSSIAAFARAVVSCSTSHTAPEAYWWLAGNQGIYSVLVPV